MRPIDKINVADGAAGGRESARPTDVHVDDQLTDRSHDTIRCAAVHYGIFIARWTAEGKLSLVHTHRTAGNGENNEKN